MKEKLVASNWHAKSANKINKCSKEKNSAALWSFHTSPALADKLLIDCNGAATDSKMGLRNFLSVCFLSCLSSLTTPVHRTAAHLDIT